MAEYSYVFKAISEIIKGSKRNLKDSINDHAVEFFGGHGQASFITRINSHLKGHCRDFFAYGSNRKKPPRVIPNDGHEGDESK